MKRLLVRAACGLVVLAFLGAPGAAQAGNWTRSRTGATQIELQNVSSYYLTFTIVGVKEVGVAAGTTSEAFDLAPGKYALRVEGKGGGTKVWATQTVRITRGWVYTWKVGNPHSSP
jgi:hypothetical protein